MRKYLIAGLLVWIPLGVTVLVVRLFVNLLDSTLLWLPPDWRPEALFGFTIPGFGVLLSIAFLFISGVLVANFLGRRLLLVWEGVLNRIPLVRSVYSAIKQVSETVLSSTGESFRKVLLIEYPRQGLWSLAFLTNPEPGEVQEKLAQDMVCVFLPTTPNPTSGFILIVPQRDVIELDMSVDEGLRMIMSVGVVSPVWPNPEAAAVAITEHTS